MLKSFLRLIRVFTLTTAYARKIKHTKSQNIPNGREIITQLKKDWARASLNNLGVEVKITGSPVSEVPMLFVGNHLSYLDIPLVMATAPVSFVAKIELSRWPIIGDACRSVGTVFVKRDSMESRKVAAKKIGDACLKDRQSICLFPSGTTALTEDRAWRKGAFEIAKINELKVQPFRINYSPRRTVAFIGEDAFIPHLWQLLKSSNIRAEIEFHEPVEVVNPQDSCLEWQRWSQEILKKN